MSQTQFLSREFANFLTSNERKTMVTARKYYVGKHDILKKERKVQTENGEKVLKNLPNNRIVNNKFDDLVDQKTNYLLSKPIEITGEHNNVYDDIFDRRFDRQLKNVGKEAFLGGVGYLIPYVTEKGLRFKCVKPEQILVFWKDEEQTIVDAFIYTYDMESYEGSNKTKSTFVEYYDKSGVKYYEWKNGELVPNHHKENGSYLSINGQAYNFEQVPLVPFKANSEMLPLITKVKSLQDALNTMMSNYADNMEEDIRNTILVVKNYDGTDLGTFRQNLATYGAIKVRTVDGADGGVDALHINVNSENYKLMIQLLKDAITENGRGFDMKDTRMGSNPNMMNIKSMYSDIDLDADEMELEFTASLEHLMIFVNAWYGLTGKTIADIGFKFNRDLPINEGEIIANCRDSVGLLSRETIISNHPWTVDTLEEIERIEQEQKQAMNAYLGGEYPQSKGGDDVDEQE